jgi:heat shock protein HtpX
MKNGLKTAVLLGSLGGLFVLVGGAIGGSSGLVIGLVIGLALCGGTYWFSDKLAIASARAKPVSQDENPLLYAIVGDLAQRANIPMPRIYVSPEQQPNAFATGRNPNHAVVCVTQGILDALPPDELKGVLAHELAHVKHRDILIGSIAAAVAMAITFVVRIALWTTLLGGDDDDGPLGIIGVLALLLLAPLAAALIQMAVSRSREYEADAGGAAMLGTGEPLARALEKLDAYAKRIPMQKVNPAQESAFIINPFQAQPQAQLQGPGPRGGTQQRQRGKSLGDYFSTHPPTAERVTRLRAMQF